MKHNLPLLFNHKLDQIKVKLANIVDKYMCIPEKGSLLEVCPIYNNIYFKTSYFSYKNILSVSLKSSILYFLCVIINLDVRYKKIYWLGHTLSKKISC